MKKYFYALLALLVVVVASCKKPEPEPIVIPEDDDKAYDVLYEVNVDYYSGYGYDGTALNYADFVKDGKHIWEHFGLNSEADFIKALGTDDVADGGAQAALSRRPVALMMPIITGAKMMTNRVSCQDIRKSTPR